MFVIILTPYKTGSCYIENVLKNSNIPHIKLHSYDLDEQKLYPMDIITHVITVRRDPIRLYISAFFEDLEYGYEYSYGKINNVTINDLIEYFNKINWKKYRWLNFTYYDEWIEKFKNNNKKTIVLQCENLLNEINTLSEFLNTTLTVFPPSHCTKNAKFGNLYIEFLKQFLSIQT